MVLGGRFAGARIFASRTRPWRHFVDASDEAHVIQRMSDPAKNGTLADQSSKTVDASKHLDVELFLQKIVLHLCSALFFALLFSYTFIILFGETWILPDDEMDWCKAAQQGFPDPVRDYPNPDSNNNPCYYERTWYLLGLNQFETTFSRRMIVSVLLGAAIGFERKAADRPAGVRTMSLVSLGEYTN